MIIFSIITMCGKSLLIINDAGVAGVVGVAGVAGVAGVVGANDMTKEEFIENETKKILMEKMCENLSQICIEYLKEDEVIDFSETGVSLLSSHMYHMGAMDVGLGEVLKSYKGQDYRQF